jgi:hypothetical protein
MSKFRDNLSVIPRGAKVAAWLVSLGLAAFVGFMASFPPDKSQPLPPAARVFVPMLTFLVVFVIIMLDGYVYGDARRRGMRYVMWTLLAIFVPDAIGVILYFILRDPMPVSCPSCSASVLSKFTFCPSCGTSVKPVCSNCGKPVEVAWSNCAHCGSKLPGIPQRAA